ncbi:MAG TPA: alpha-L-rhamnosidase C-terminal domain-containing protein [Gaiellaceae bacterium]|nr:alpha-L-rhamnosidase C-terminal domain-containing protein [Gaiellaceae bacterium]
MGRSAAILLVALVLASLSAVPDGAATPPKQTAAKAHKQAVAPKKRQSRDTTIPFSDDWKQLVVSGNTPEAFKQATVTAGSPLTLTWSHEMAGQLELSFGAVTPGTVIKVGFSETAKYLSADGSDWFHSYPVDEHQAASNQVWVDQPGCESPGVCADGYRAFRFARVSVAQGSATIMGAQVALPASVGTPQGWFLSSDRLLNRAWYASAYTAQLLTMPNDPAILDPRGCSSPGGTGMLVVVDGAKRDRCPWIDSVTPLTLMLTGADRGNALTNTLTLLANGQRSNGYLPPSPSAALTKQLIDLPLYFVTAVKELLLYRGTSAAAGYYPNVTRLLDGWYQSLIGPDGLVRDPAGENDYAFINRSGDTIAYYNALYADALLDAASIADLLGHPADASRWRARESAIASAFESTFWDPKAGAFIDSPKGPVVHPLDGNALAILAGIPTPAQTNSAINYVNGAMDKPWGTAIADNDAWYYFDWGPSPSGRVYPFISYLYIAGEFANGFDEAALDQIRQTWGWMLDGTDETTGTAWEAIGAGGSIDGYQGPFTSMAHGWSTGAVPALTNDALGIAPTGPGFSSFDAIPHPGDLTWAQGGVPTPAGMIELAWQKESGGYLLQLFAPPSLHARVGIAAPATATVLVDGQPRIATVSGPDVVVSVQGSHTVEITTG